MKGIPLIRAAVLTPFIRFLDRLGAPVEHALEREHLPVRVCEHPDGYLPTLHDWAFLENVSHAQGIADLGLRVSSGAGLANLAPELERRVRRAPTLLRGIEVFCGFVREECTGLRCWPSVHGAEARVNLVPTFARDTPGYGQSEWRGLVSVLDCIRIFAGQQWHPTELALGSPGPPAPLAYELFDRTRFREQQPLVHIAFPRWMLAGSPGDQLPVATGRERPEPTPDFTESLKKALKVYIEDGHPRIQLAAEISGLSVRTLQRELAEAGRSYRALVEEARFETAAQLLLESDARSVEVAYALGYTDPSNFARAFRRFSGVSPREYRRQNARPAC
jgi:AraC-like DNA-binding protein